MRMISALPIAAMLGIITIAGIVSPAAAESPTRGLDRKDQYIAAFCQKYRGADQCNDWRAHHASWTSDHYLNFYRRHQEDKDFANPAAAKLFGFPPGQQ
jgi:hypothetical protein